MSTQIGKNKNNLAKIKEKIINQKDSWMLGEDIPSIDFQFSEIWMIFYRKN